MVLKDQAKARLKEGLATTQRKARKRMADANEAGALAGRLHNQKLPNLSFETRDPAALKAPGRNVRKPSQAQVLRVGRAIERTRHVQPVLIDGQDEIIDGVTTVAAATALGLKEVPVVVADHLTAQEKDYLRISLNALPSRVEWDQENLRTVIVELLAADFDLEVAFEAPTIDLILADDAQDEVSKFLNTPPAPTTGPTPNLRAGDVWVMGQHRLMQGDALNPDHVRALMAGRDARAVITDPPYNVGGDVVSGLRGDRHGDFVSASGEMTDEAFQDFLEKALANAVGHLMDGGLAVVFMDWRHLWHLLGAGRRLKLGLVNTIVWVKSQGGMGSLYRSQHEFAAIFKRGSAPHVNNVELGRHGRDRTNVWSYPGANTMGSSARAALSDHPTPKSVEMIADAILDITKPGEIVLDPFMGSGTTFIAAERARRVAYGLELDARYVEVCIKRWQDLTGVAATLLETDEALHEVLARRAREAEEEGLDLSGPTNRASDAEAEERGRE